MTNIFSFAPQYLQSSYEKDASPKMSWSRSMIFILMYWNQIIHVTIEWKPLNCSYVTQSKTWNRTKFVLFDKFSMLGITPTKAFQCPKTAIHTMKYEEVVPGTIEKDVYMQSLSPLFTVPSKYYYIPVHIRLCYSLTTMLCTFCPVSFYLGGCEINVVLKRHDYWSRPIERETARKWLQGFPHKL